MSRLLLALALCWQSGDAPVTPPAAVAKPLTAERQKAVAHKVIALQNEVIALQRQQLALVDAEKKVNAAKAELDGEIEAARKESGAASACGLTVEMEWQCPKQP